MPSYDKQETVVRITFSHYEMWRSQSELILFVSSVLENWDTAGHRQGPAGIFPSLWLVRVCQHWLLIGWQQPRPPGADTRESSDDHEFHFCDNINTDHPESRPLSLLPWHGRSLMKHLQIMNQQQNFSWLFITDNIWHQMSRLLASILQTLISSSTGRSIFMLLFGKDRIGQAPKYINIKVKYSFSQ